MELLRIHSAANITLNVAQGFTGSIYIVNRHSIDSHGDATFRPCPNTNPRIIMIDVEHASLPAR
jgi:hypothetical protein